MLINCSVAYQAINIESGSCSRRCLSSNLFFLCIRPGGLEAQITHMSLCIANTIQVYAPSSRTDSFS